MCCAFLILVVLGPRALDILWWLIQPARWQVTFSSWPGAFWVWPLLGIIFLPWTTLMYVLIAPGGIEGLAWLWIGLGLAADIATYTGGAGRKRVPGYTGY
ncbi:MAG: hypothetical protein U0768_15585 [Anaerolineae bacterium]